MSVASPPIELPPYALTYPQLMRQAHERGVDHASLLRPRDAYEIAERLADGIYQPQGMPFLCHLVRTASIVLEQDQGIDVAVAAMLHAVYRLDRHDQSTRRASRPAHRRYLSRRVGPEAEAIVWAFEEVRWTPREVACHRERLATSPPAVRKALVIYIANALENRLDMSMAFGAKLAKGTTGGGVWPGLPALARELGVPRLADQLIAVDDETGRWSLPPELVRQHLRAYELPSHLLWRKTVPERLYARAGREARHLGRGLRRPRRLLAALRRGAV